MMTDSTRELLTINQATTRTGVSRRTIYNWIAQRKVEYLRTAGGAVRIVADSLFQSGEQQQASSDAGATGVAPSRADSGHLRT